MSTTNLTTATAAPIAPELTAATSLPSGFSIEEVAPTEPAARTVSTPPPSLGPLAAFTGNFTGSGFNTIFRPDSAKTPTVLPIPVSGSDNVLELNLTTESLSFSAQLGSVPNRGTGQQGDVFLNGVPYLQAITDVTVPTAPTPIHLEPGIWVIVPPTTIPTEGTTLARMASIPHGTTIVAQGTSFPATNGPPTIAAVDITPFTTGNPSEKIPFPSQTATNEATPRIPQNLSSFVKAGTITQAMLTDPNTVLRNQIAGQTITSTTTLSVFTSAPTSASVPSFGGGAENIAFLLGNAGATTPNAQTLKMTATFWIETVQHQIVVPPSTAGERFTISAPSGHGVPAVSFLVIAPTASTTPRTIKVSSTQIQYSQEVFLNFNGLTWPHVSVATLVPAAPIAVPASAFG
jgi:hypothetical protein